MVDTDGARAPPRGGFEIGACEPRLVRPRTGRDSAVRIELELLQALERRIQPSPGFGPTAKALQWIAGRGERLHLVKARRWIVADFGQMAQHMIIDIESPAGIGVSENISQCMSGHLQNAPAG